MRSGKSLQELLRFGAVGASGVVVNMLAMIIITSMGPPPEDPVVELFSTRFHVRWYHAFSFAAFLLANLWNFQWNRNWTFKSRRHWGQQYSVFLSIGILAQGLALVVLTLLMHPGSPIALSRSLFDDSSVLLTRVYWAQLFTIASVTPVSFLLNKAWTFRPPAQH